MRREIGRGRNRGRGRENRQRERNISDKKINATQSRKTNQEHKCGSVTLFSRLPAPEGKRLLLSLHRHRCESKSTYTCLPGTRLKLNQSTPAACTKLSRVVHGLLNIFSEDTKSQLKTAVQTRISTCCRPAMKITQPFFPLHPRATVLKRLE